MLDLDKRSIMYLPGVGPKKAEILQKEAGISSYEDLLFYFPYKYIDRSRFYKVAEVTGDMPYIQLKGRILFFDTVGEGRTRRLIGKFTDGTGTIDLVWFKGINYVMDKIKTGVDYIVFGKPAEFGHIYNIPHPDIDSLDQADKVASGLTPFYNTSEKMKKSFLNSRAIQNLQYTLWKIPSGFIIFSIPSVKLLGVVVKVIMEEPIISIVSLIAMVTAIRIPSTVIVIFHTETNAVPGVRNRLNTTVIINRKRIPFIPLTINRKGTWDSRITTAKNTAATI